MKDIMSELAKRKPGAKKKTDEYAEEEDEGGSEHGSPAEDAMSLLKHWIQMSSYMPKDDDDDGKAMRMLEAKHRKDIADHFAECIREIVSGKEGKKEEEEDAA